jgi:hypothetical protein
MLQRRKDHRRDSTQEWLLQGDPALRWQVLRDLVHAPAKTFQKERHKVGDEGWGVRLLALQDKSGTWGGGFYTPKWTSTTYTLLQLRDFGLTQNHPQAQRACEVLLENGLRADGGINFGKSDQSETCITGMVLALLAYFRCGDSRVDIVADHLLTQQMDDGGWNCRRPHGATHASMNTTITALEALREYELNRHRKRPAVRKAQARGREFLLVHRLFRSHRTGNIIKTEFTRLAYPPRWHYDILRALDYFQVVDAPRDRRLGEAIEIVRKAQLADGCWPLQYDYVGKTHFRLERVGAASRWNTLRALRVLQWWDRAATKRRS